MSKERLIELIHAAKGKRVICVGDVMLDRFVYGSVDRISPEAPVPILRRSRQAAMPGGAANVARNLASLGVETVLVGVIGDDFEGRELSDAVDNVAGITSHLIVSPERPTTLKTRFVTGGQQLLRVDAEDNSAIDKSVSSNLVAALNKLNGTVDLVVLSDYAKGTLTPEVIRHALNFAKSNDIPIIADPKGRDFSKYGAVDLIKPNGSELGHELDCSVEADVDIEAALKEAIVRFPAEAVVVTRAAKGMSYLELGGDVQHRAGQAREVFDVSGAGDTSIAALAVGLVANGSIDEAVSLAIAASGLAVGKSGTATVSASELVTSLTLAAQPHASGHVPLSSLKPRTAAWREAGLTVGFTNGCFDILHPGHLKVLEEAKARCKRLIVGLNSDASVSRLKGKERPINSAEARARVLLGLSAVDAVVVFEEDTPQNLIEALQPDLLVKGGDYELVDIVGADIVQARGGTVYIVPIVEGQSTTASIARAQGHSEKHDV